MNFEIKHCIDRPMPRFENIEIKGYFSLDCERAINFDCSQLRYYKHSKNKKVHLNLNVGIEKSRIFSDNPTDHNLDNILQWIQLNEGNETSIQRETKSTKPKFVCRRGTIDCLLKMPFNTIEGMIICAAKWRGSIYLRRFDTDASLSLIYNQASFRIEMSYWAYNFQQHFVADVPDESPNTSKPVDQNPQFCCIFQSNLGDHTLVYSAKMDAVCSDKILKDPLPLNDLKFIGLKTHRVIKSEVQRIRFERYSTLKWWTLFAPTGVGNILCGFRDKEGLVTQLETFSVVDLMNTKNDHWDPSTSLNFCNDFLTYIANTVVNDCDNTIYKFEKLLNNNIITMTELSPHSEYSVLPEWYTKHTA